MSSHQREGIDPLNTPIQYVKGVGPYIGKLLNKKGIHKVWDLFYYFPIRYLDRRNISTIWQLTPGKERCIMAQVVEGGRRQFTRRRLYDLVVKDQTGVAHVVWFHFNEKYLQKKYPPGKKILIFGDCQFFGSQKQFTHPDIEDWEGDPENYDLSIAPVYSLTEGLYQKSIRRIIFNALDHYLPHLEETPLTVRADGTVKVSLKESIEKIHRPPQEAPLADLGALRSVWHQRVIYDELFFLQLGLALRKKNIKKESGFLLKPSSKLLPQALGLLPFQLTQAQKRVLKDIEQDLLKGEPMNRMLQGDVGSGKTMVAFLSALIACENGYQAALMAPTEILAQQHFLNLSFLGTKLDIRVALLLGSTPKKEKNEILKDLADHRIHFIIGTHALIQDGVDFNKLGLIVIDEQHRFGVLQRAALKNKNVTHDSTGLCPHILVMTATPIPRTLAMSVYGDLDVSIIDELPVGRKPIITKVCHEKQRPQAYELIRRELAKGHQAYFVYPLIEESEKSDLKDAMSMAEHLKEIFKEYQVGVLHGRMSAADKEEIMKRFKAREIHILVSTTVVEVGVDVPNSTVMCIEHAERFGLSQLHQLRGRVGRGGDQSFCLLIAGYAQSEESRFRLKIMEETNDGFKVAEEDLKIRGPGDFLGTRQSGLPDFQLAHLVRDQHLLNAAQKRANEVIERDPDLSKPEHQLLKKILTERWGDKLDLAEVS